MRKRWYLLKKSVSRRWNRLIYTISPITHDKRKQEGSGTAEDPYRWVVIEKAKRDRLARLVSRLFPKDRSGEYPSKIATLQHLGFKAFVRHPYTGFAVVQVKEKYGTLRFYCPATPAIDKYTRLAERLSAVTCEDCGKPGEPNESGWISTLCEECRNTRFSPHAR